MPAIPMWRVKPGRMVYDGSGKLKARSGDLLPLDDVDAMRNLSLVTRVMHDALDIVHASDSTPLQQEPRGDFEAERGLRTREEDDDEV